MAVPTFGNSTTSSESSNVTAIDVSRVGGISVGDLLIITVFVQSSATGVGFAAVDGFEQIGDLTAGSNVTRPRGGVFARVADGTEITPVNVRFTGTGGGGRAFAVYARYSGVDPDNPFQSFEETIPVLNTDSIDLVGVPAAGQSLALAWAASINTTFDMEVIDGIGWPPGSVEVEARSGTSGSQVGGGFVHKEIVNAGSTEDVEIGKANAERMAGYQLVILSGAEPPPAGGTLEIFDGVEFVSGIPKVFDGVEFVTATPRIFDGVEFVP